MAGPSLPLTPERPPAAPSAASPLLLCRPAAAIPSTPAPGRAAGSPSGVVYMLSAEAAAARLSPQLGLADSADAAGAAPPAPASPALLEARAGVQEADALLRQAQAQRWQLWDLADRLLATERGGRWEAEQALGQARHQVRLRRVLCKGSTFDALTGLT